MGYEHMLNSNRKIGYERTLNSNRKMGYEHTLNGNRKMGYEHMLKPKVWLCILTSKCGFSVSLFGGEKVSQEVMNESYS